MFLFFVFWQVLPYVSQYRSLHTPPASSPSGSAASSSASASSSSTPSASPTPQAA